MAQPQTAKPLKINPFKGDPHCFQTFQDELRLIFDSYSTTFQDAQGNTDDRKKIIYALQNMTNGNAADSYVAWQQDITNLINNFQKYKLHNSSSKSQTPISFYGDALNDQKKKFIYQE
ncbi:hypothetical protein P691DRAFT_768714 [Macrolepiota fuliginosa MF-IS2]|uniref:Uncharacterized protein n=1 Tax=Macrolepiota fuliginosa MF-IS2 TaxID=1400762 RepID=A0A9P5WW17_9AGAR|nr:hypothetical protein P691DRAFT_768714 [Macrolepiota fuliginosa MF-IS2]